MNSSERNMKISVLLVENNPVEFAQNAKVLSRLGYMLHVAENGHEGLRLFREKRPDIVVTEAALPVIDGLEMVRQIREIDTAAQVVVITGLADASSLLTALDLGVQHYLLKPLDEEKFAAALDRCVESLYREREFWRLRRVAEALDQAGFGVAIADPEGIIESANSVYCELAGYAADGAIGLEMAAVEAGTRFTDPYRAMRESLASGQPWHGEVQGRRNSNGECIWKNVRFTPLGEGDGAVRRFACITEDISGRMRREEEIRRLNAELEYRVLQRNATLEASKKELDDFCDAVSHDLRGPLSRLQGFSAMLQEECRDALNEQAKLCVERIGKTSRDLKQIIDGLLNLSQLSRRAMVYQEVDLGVLARSVADLLQARRPGRMVEWVISPGVVVKGDPGLLTILLENLMDNAWKCTSRNMRGRIEFGVARSDSRAVYFVRDNGIGFDNKYMIKLFRPFQRIHTAEEFNGAGLGLAASQRVIQRHGGRIWVEGEVERGATFYFTLN